MVTYMLPQLSARPSHDRSILSPAAEERPPPLTPTRMPGLAPLPFLNVSRKFYRNSEFRPCPFEPSWVTIFFLKKCPGNASNRTDETEDKPELNHLKHAESDLEMKKPTTVSCESKGRGSDEDESERRETEEREKEGACEISGTKKLSPPPLSVALFLSFFLFLAL